MNNFNGLNNENDNNRTKAFTIQKKQRKVDSVSWIVGALLLFFLNLMSLGRITIIGQFIDDAFFNLPFGWFKYFLYLLFFMVDFAIYFGIKFKPKKRFLAMIFLTWIVLCWIISSILFVVSYHTNSEQFNISKVWSPTILKDSVNSYITNWKANSFFNNHSGFWVADPKTYFTFWAGGGLVGTLLSGIGAYTSIYFGLVLALLFFIIDMVWIFTGDPFYFLKAKNKRTGKRLRILSLKSDKDPNILHKTKKQKKNKGIFSLINIEDDETFDERIIMSSLKESDITIELPSYNRQSERKIYEEVHTDFYNDDFVNINLDDYNPEMNYKDQFINQPNQGMNRVMDFNLDKIREEAKFKAEASYKGEPIYTPVVEDDFEYDYDYPMPVEYKHGQILTEKAREQLLKESSVTPFGANGKTQELVKSKSKKEEIPSGQITLDHFINETERERKEEVKQRSEYNDYTSPMQENFAKSILFPSSNYKNQSKQSKTSEININKAVEKVQFVNDSYELPSINILKDQNIDPIHKEEAKKRAEAKAEAINETFRQFGVKATVSNMSIGPSVIKFEIQPGPATKVNSIISLENDLKLALASQNVRIESPIPGKSVVGIEIPNEKPEIVSMKSVLSGAPSLKMGNKLLFVLGKTVTGEDVFGELDKTPHLLVAGSTGSGKSVMINGIISSILMRAKPHEVKFLMIDPKKVELSIYSSIPHLLAPVISDMTIAKNALKKVINEMDRRYALFTTYGVKNIEGFNSIQKTSATKLPYFVIVIDELADLMMTSSRKEVEDSITRLTQLARASGIHLIVATQRPSTDVITGVIKSNIPVRIAFSVASSIDSRTILDASGAEKLIGKGDLLYTPPLTTNLIRAQGAYISDEEIEVLVKYCSNQQQQVFEEEFLKQDEDENNTSMGANSDPLYDEVIDFIIQNGASTSSIQRRFKIGYNRAARIMDELEMNGDIGPQNGSKPREVYINKK